MTIKQLKEAAALSCERGEDLNLSQAIEWMYAYKLITYKEYSTFLHAAADIYKKILLQLM
jgi:hypothetical protein